MTRLSAALFWASGLHFVAINQSFFMGFILVISCYFTPGWYDRKGPGPHVLDRLKRQGIPLLFRIVMLDPLPKFVMARTTGALGSLGEFLVQHVQNTISNGRSGVGPLWFVAALLFFSLPYVLWPLVFKQPAAPPPSEAKAPSNRAVAGFAWPWDC